MTIYIYPYSLQNIMKHEMLSWGLERSGHASPNHRHRLHPPPSYTPTTYNNTEQSGSLGYQNMVQEKHSPNNNHNLLLLLLWSLTCSTMEEPRARSSFCHMADMTTIGWERCWNQNVSTTVSRTIYYIYILLKYQDIKINKKCIILKTF